MSAAMRQPAGLTDKLTFGIDDDFGWFISPHLWTTFNDTNCTATITANAVGGVVALAGASNTDNDQVGISTTNAFFKFQANCDLEFVCRLAYSEANTDDANVCVGLSSDFTTDIILDNGASPDVNHSGALIYKLDGGTVWRCHSSKGATQTDTASVTSSNTGTTYVELKIKAREQGDGNVRVDFFVDDQPLRDSNNKAISHTVAYASALAMKAGVMVKNGGSNGETVSVDFVKCFQSRR